MTKKTTKGWEREFDRLIRSFNKQMLEADLMFTEEGWEYELKQFIQFLLSQQRKELIEEVEKELDEMETEHIKAGFPSEDYLGAIEDILAKLKGDRG